MALCLQSEVGAGAGQRVDHDVHDRPRRFDEVIDAGDAHPAQAFLVLIRAAGRRPRITDSRAWDAEAADERAVGLTAHLWRVAVRASLDTLPSAIARLHDPVLRIRGAARRGAEHLPVELDLRMALVNRAHRLGKLRLDLAGRGARIASHVEINFGRGRREGRPLWPSRAQRRDMAFRKHGARRVTRGVLREPRLDLLDHPNRGNY